MSSKDERPYLWLLRVVLNELEPGNTLVLPSRAAHHLRVRHVALGETFLATNGKGKEGVCRLISLDPVKAEVEKVYSPLERELMEPPILAFGIVKDTRLEWAIKSAVEAGIRNFLPVITIRSLPGVSVSKTERWRKMAVEAMKQCGGVILPVVQDPIPLERLKGYRGAFLSTTASKPLKETRDGFELVVVGPEGGFTVGEEDMMREWGWSCYGLGPRILRTGTAMVVVSALVSQGRFSER